MTIEEAILSLDPNDDNLWTADGLPRVESVQELVGDIAITRQDITDVDPSFHRDKAATPGQSEEEVLPIAPKTVKDYDQELGQLELERVALERKIRDITAQRDKLFEETIVHSSPLDDTRARVEYIRKQGELRAARVAKHREMLKGIDLQTLDPRTPLDQAMSRDNRRGVARPNIPANIAKGESEDAS